MSLRKYLQASCLGTTLCLAGLAGADEVVHKEVIVLKSGSTIIGTVTGSRDGVVTIETDFADPLEISLDKIASVKTSAPVVIQLADERVLPEQPLLIEQDQLVIGTATSPQESYALENLLLVNPEPWELGQGYRWKGVVSVAASAQRGNTDTDDLNYSLESIWRSKLDRYTLRYNGENEKTNSETTVEKWYAQGKYDYFFDGPIYGGFQGSAEHDKFTDLDLRYLIGPYIGRQFYEEPILALSAEIGASYVDEDFIEAEDRDYIAANWAVNASSNYLGGDSRLYLDHRGIVSMDDSSDYILNLILGLAFPLVWSLEAAAELQLDYDNGAVEGVDKLDQTYRLRLGYTW